MFNGGDSGFPDAAAPPGSPLPGGGTNEAGNVDSQSDGDWAAFAAQQRVEQVYDANARPVVQRLVSGSTTYALSQASYDALGRVQCAAQRMNPAEFASLPSDACTLDTQGSYGPDRIARTTYDAAGQVTKVETGYGVSGAAADEATATYSANGRVATLTDANGNRTGYAYDGFDRPSRTYMPSPTTPGTSSTTDFEELTYDPAGNVTSRRLRDGDNIGYSYDALNRLTAKDLPATAWYNLDRAYSYDNLGRLRSADGNSLFQTAYDGLGRLTSEDTPFGSVSHQYDAAGRRTRLTYADGFYLAYDRLVTGEVSAIRENGATSGAGLLAVYAHDDLGRRTLLTRGNATSTSYSYDSVSRLSGLTQDLNGTSNDLTFGYSYNPASEIVSSTRSNDAYSFTLANANVASSSDGLNRLTSIAGSSIGYDARGNASSVPAAGSVTGTARNFEYNSDNALVVATDSSGGRQETMPDSLERLFRYYDGGANRWFTYDGHQLIAETNSSGTAIARRYVHGPETDEPLVWYEGSGTSDRRWLHADERGSVVAASDGSGNLVGSAPNRYDDYGTPQGGSLTGRFGYTGQAWLPEVGLYDYRARFYNPALGGRFMQTDPIGFEGGMNPYAYAGNNPVNFTDPTGLGPRPCVVVSNGSQSEPPTERCSDDWPSIGGANIWDRGVSVFDFGLLEGGDGGDGGSGLGEDRCAARATPLMPGGMPPVSISVSSIQSVAQASFIHHSIPINVFTLRTHSMFGGTITNGESLAEAAEELIYRHTYVPAGALHARITGDMGRPMGRDYLSRLPSTNYLTVIIVGPTGVTAEGMIRVIPISMYPGC